MTQSHADRAQRYAEFERRVGPWMLGFSIAFVPVFLMGFLPRVPEFWRSLADEVSWGIWLVFVIEFGVRLILAPDRIRMLRTHVFDLLVLVLPFLRVFRGVRALRSIARAVFAIGGMTLSGRALETTRRVARGKGVPYVIGLVALAAVAGALIVLHVETGAPGSNIGTVGDALWWALSTVTTVGYGDRYPTTTEGRVVAFALMLLGLGLFSLVTARIAAFFVGDDQVGDEARKTFEQVNERLERVERLLLESLQRQSGSGPATPRPDDRDSSMPDGPR